MAPPSGDLGQSPNLNCGWHQSCLPWNPTPGIGLDWDNTGQNNSVWFRGWAFKNNAPLQNNQLRGDPWEWGGVGVCDFVDVRVWENTVNKLRFDMQYYHTQATSLDDFPIITSGSGAENNYHIADMTEDDPACSTGLHVHEKNADPCGWPVYCSRNTGLYGDYNWCGPPDFTNCRPFLNSTILNSTRAFDWHCC